MTTLEYSSFTSNDDENVLFRSESSLPVKKKRKTLFFGTLLPQCLTLSFLVAIIITFTVISTSYIAALSEQNNDSSTQENNLNRIRNITQYAWASYRKFAWPVSGTSGNFIFSAMSTLYLMDLQMEFSEGRRWIEHEFNFAEFDGFVKVHDVITNHLGGLLSLYGLTSDTLFLKKSIEVGDVLLKQAFNPKTGIVKNCYTFSNFFQYLGFLYDKINPKQKTFQDFSNSMPISQSGYYQPELILLGQLTNNSILFDHLQKIATQRNHFWTKNDTKQANEKPVKDIFHNLLCSYILSDRRDIVAISLLNSTISFTVEYSFKHKLPNALTYSLNNLLHREHFNETLLFAQDCALGALLTISATEINHFNNTIRDPIKRHYFNKYFKAGVNITKTCHRALRMTKKLPFEFTVHEGVVSSFNGTNSAFL